MKKSTNRWIWAMQAVLLLPFFLIAFYVWPSSDDYAMSYLIAENSNGILGVLRYLYLNWGGRYATLLGATLSPIVVEHLWVHRLLIFLTLALLLWVLRWFGSRILANKGQKGITMAALFLLLWLQVVPGIAESFYWYSGVVVYIWPLVGLFFVWGGLLGNNKSVPHYFILLISAFILSGFNEMAAGMALLTALVAVFNIEDRRFNKRNLLLLAVVVVGVVMLLASPGNAKRMELFANGANWADALQISFVSLVKLNGIHLQSLPLWLVALLLFKGLTPDVFHHRLQPFLKGHPVVVLVAGQLMLWGLLFVPAWSMGINPPLRVYGFLSPLWLLWFAWLLVSVRVRYAGMMSEWPRFTGVGFKAMVLLTALSFMVSFVKVPGGGIVFGGNVPQAWHDVLFRAGEYNSQMKEREQLIHEARESGKTELAVPALEQPPKTIFFIDMTPNADHWINPLYARRYGLERVWVEE